MRRLPVLAILSMALASPALAGDVTASAPDDLSVTIYRDPSRNGGTMELRALGGFAVVSETRRVIIPAGRSRLRFVGVVDGILPESAIVSGLGDAVFEKNRDNALLSPASLLRATQGREVMLRRTDRATGKPVLTPARIVSASEDGVVFATAKGEEGLRCSGFPEMFSYGIDGSGLSAQPVLSVAVRSPRAVTAMVKLTYLAQGFDWNASYTAAVTPDGGKLDLGGWITLANANSVSLADAKVQIVAGGLNRAEYARFFDTTPRAVAKCWTIRTTSQIPRKPERPYELVHPYDPDEGRFDGMMQDSPVAVTVVTGERLRRKSAVMEAPAPAPPPPPPPPPPPEQLGDLKLYRLPDRTTVAANQMKQSRLVENPGVEFARVATLTLPVIGYEAAFRPKFNPVTILRSRNDKRHGLGLPLPAGMFVIEQDHAGRTMLLGQPALRDTAEDDKIELALGPSPDVTIERRTLSQDKRGQRQEVTISSASPEPVDLELRFEAYGAQRLEEADAELGKEDGQPIFKLRIEPQSTRTIHYAVRWN